MQYFPQHAQCGSDLQRVLCWGAGNYGLLAEVQGVKLKLKRVPIPRKVSRRQGATTAAGHVWQRYTSTGLAHLSRRCLL
jgi:hypothetical protein